MLVLATAFWAFSFPTMKALQMVQQAHLPGASTWFFAGLCVVYRFGIAALVMLLWCGPTLRRFTWLEVWEGAGLGFCASAGLVFQMDGLAYTSASTSAFLTQCYCLIIPAGIAVWERRWPSPLVVVSCLLVVAGVATLSGLDLNHLRLGRGEIETLVASLLFAGQIVWLQRPRFARNNVNHFTVVMFAVVALVAAPVAWHTAPTGAAWWTAYASPASLACLGLLVGFCTLAGYLLMNYWQPGVTATQAGLIYCVEPVFASLLSLFLPAWCSRLGRIDYANEQVTRRLLVGGGLILVANYLVQRASLTPPTSAAGASPGPALPPRPNPDRA